MEDHIEDKAIQMQLENITEMVEWAEELKCLECLGEEHLYIQHHLVVETLSIHFNNKEDPIEEKEIAMKMMDMIIEEIPMFIETRVQLIKELKQWQIE